MGKALHGFPDSTATHYQCHLTWSMGSGPTVCLGGREEELPDGWRAEADERVCPSLSSVRATLHPLRMMEIPGTENSVGFSRGL